MVAVQYTFTHKQYAEQHNETEYKTNITIKIKTKRMYVISALIFISNFGTIQKEGFAQNTIICNSDIKRGTKYRL